MVSRLAVRWAVCPRETTDLQACTLVGTTMSLFNGSLLAFLLRSFVVVPAISVRKSYPRRRSDSFPL